MDNFDRLTKGIESIAKNMDDCVAISEHVYEIMEKIGKDIEFGRANDLLSFVSAVNKLSTCMIKFGDDTHLLARTVSQIASLNIKRGVIQ
jgi:hypothetical protein